MKKDKKIELAGKKTDELLKLLHDAKNTLFSMRLDHVQQKLKNTRSLFHKRKEIARIITKMREKELIHHE